MREKITEPTFFIVGAARSGTSSLAYYLGQHPDIFMSPVKEPAYFVLNSGCDDYDEYIMLFNGAGDAQAVGEASTGYLFDEHAAGTIKKRFPKAKIIIILRNPVAMAFSYWRYMLKYGSESKSFEEAISEEEIEYRKSNQIKRYCENWWGSYLYLERALYFNQVKRYLDVFGHDQVKVCIFERFVRQPENICHDLFAFLGVNSSFVPDCKKVVNEGGEARLNFIKNLTKHRYPLLRNLLPVKFRRVRFLLMDFNTKKGKKFVMKAATRRTLENFFHNDIMNLESLLGDKIPEWR